MSWLRAVCLLTTFVPAPLFAASVFDGTWKQDSSSGKMAGKPMVMTLKDGIYACDTCTPPYRVKADGTDQAVSGHPDYDSVALTAVDVKTVHETEKLSGKIVSDQTVSIAPGGKSATVKWRDTHGTAPVMGTTELVLVSAGPAGSHAISGAWKFKSMGQVSDSGMLTTLKVEGGKVSLSLPTGETYDAAVNGPDAPFTGDKRVQTVSVKMPSAHEIIESDKRDGKVIAIVDMVVAGNGRTMKMVFTNKVSGRTASFTAYKQ